MNKLPAAIWAVGFAAWSDVANYLEFLENRPRDTSTSYAVIELIMWIGGVLLFWPWRKT